MEVRVDQGVDGCLRHRLTSRLAGVVIHQLEQLAGGFAKVRHSPSIADPSAAARIRRGDPGTGGERSRAKDARIGRAPDAVPRSRVGPGPAPVPAVTADEERPFHGPPAA